MKIEKTLKDHSIIIFDGVCNFCNASVNFIIKRDAAAKFLFTPMQSDIGRSLMEKYSLLEVYGNTLILIKNNRVYVRSDAAIEIAKELDGYWYLCGLFTIIPRKIRDFFYKLFARHRYKLFGKKEECMLPTEKVKARFIES